MALSRRAVLDQQLQLTCCHQHHRYAWNLYQTRELEACVGHLNSSYWVRESREVVSGTARTLEMHVCFETTPRLLISIHSPKQQTAQVLPVIHGAFLQRKCTPPPPPPSISFLTHCPPCCRSSHVTHVSDATLTESPPASQPAAHVHHHTASNIESPQMQQVPYSAAY